MNHNHVSTALDTVEAVAATRERLAELYETARVNRARDYGVQIAEAHQSIGYGLKRAGVLAQIAQADALERIVGQLGSIATYLGNAG